MAQQQNLKTPVGRIVMGNLYRPRTTDMEGRPLLFKTGAKAGQPRNDYFFAVAIPKGAEVSAGYGKFNWAATPWGGPIYQAGLAFRADAATVPGFSWKVADGDDATPNGKGNALATREGCPGHWILYFGGSNPPRICDAKGEQAITEVDAVKPGHFVQVGFYVDNNGSQTKPGLYLNTLAVAHQGYGPEIFTGVDTKSFGFGQEALPPGASAVPLAQMGNAALPGMPPAAPALPPAVGQALPPAAVVGQVLPGMAVAAAALPPMAGAPALPQVQPNAAFLQVPPPGATLPALPALQPAGVRLTPAGAATGHTLESLRQQGYTDEVLIQHGYATR